MFYTYVVYSILHIGNCTHPVRKYAKRERTKTDEAKLICRVPYAQVIYVAAIWVEKMLHNTHLSRKLEARSASKTVRFKNDVSLSHGFSVNGDGPSKNGCAAYVNAMATKKGKQYKSWTMNMEKPPKTPSFLKANFD